MKSKIVALIKTNAQNTQHAKHTQNIRNTTQHSHNGRTHTKENQQGKEEG